MRIHIIACQVLGRELGYYAALSPHIVDIHWLPQGLHETPQLLKRQLQLAIREAEDRTKCKPDVIALGYGLCSNGVLGLCARETPLVVPRTDDCIALFLGSQKRYLELFQQYNGTYWVNNGWLEHAYVPSEENVKKRHAEYVELYGEDNADFLLDQDQQWQHNYNCCGYITSPVYINPDYEEQAKAISQFQNWKYAHIEGDTRMLEMLAGGQWPEEEFLTCPPGFHVEASFDVNKIKAVPNDGTERI
ncbi:MAG: DUF1638 domain-containing protein [Eubacteriales bacterium]|jgi:hypothetical protein